MCHAPASLFGVSKRGYLREGYYADIAIIDPKQPHTVTTDNILSRCGWSPMEGHTYPHTVTHTLVNGVVAYENGTINDSCRGELLLFER